MTKKHLIFLTFIVSLFFPFLNGSAQNNTGSRPAQKPGQQVNVFLGTSGDHGQLSPAADSPFNMMSIGPQTTPHIHTGYEYYAKEFLGFTHTRIEGVGCRGSGGNILIKPVLNGDTLTSLIKNKQDAHPGYYRVNFKNGIQAEMTEKQDFGMHRYEFPGRENGLFVDLSYAFLDRFMAEEHKVDEYSISGWIDTKTICNRGVYRIYYTLQFDNMDEIKPVGPHKFLVRSSNGKPMEVRVGFSSVSTAYSKKRIEDGSFSGLKKETAATWDRLLGRIRVNGEKDREELFYSLLYRALQSPYVISEDDGTYAAIDGSKQKSGFKVYNGWAIWDNYREQLPMLSLAYPEKFGDISKSIANLYNFGKKDWTTDHEPSPSVRTEHAIIVLLDAYNKGYPINFQKINDSLIKETENLDFSSPDKALESSYDNWAMANILKITGDTARSEKFKEKALGYKTYWNKEFKDLSKDDVDKMQARGLYQGTIWQYRWFVPFDVSGLKKLVGGEAEFSSQMDRFFDENNYNHANQPDLQVPGMYNATAQPWKSQKIYRNIMLDTVVQNYFNNNSKGIDPYIGKIYNNRPKAYLRTMDDDAGTMSSWFVMRSMGLSPANVGSPVYYLTTPIFKAVRIKWDNGKTFEINVKNYNKDHFYIKSVQFNGKTLNRNWLTQKEITQGGELIIETTAEPNKNWGLQDQWISKY